MIQSLPKLLTFDEFIEWLPESRRYELHEGAIIEIQPTGKHGNHSFPPVKNEPTAPW